MNSHLKTFFTYITVFVLVISCKTHKSTTSATPTENFTTEFEQTVLKHKPDEILKFMTNDYVKEQHDEFLQGRTKQFLNEFFCGNTDTKPSKFKCVDDITQIKEIVRVSITPTNYGHEYVFKIKINNEWIRVNCSISNSPSKHNPKMGLVGASG